ncbi:hypothetical protein RUND412_005512 [Rhizina undulata]
MSQQPPPMPSEAAQMFRILPFGRREPARLEPETPAPDLPFPRNFVLEPPKSSSEFPAVMNIQTLLERMSCGHRMDELLLVLAEKWDRNNVHWNYRLEQAKEKNRQDLEKQNEYLRLRYKEQYQEQLRRQEALEKEVKELEYVNNNIDESLGDTWDHHKAIKQNIDSEVANKFNESERQGDEQKRELESLREMINKLNERDTMLDQNIAELGKEKQRIEAHMQSQAEFVVESYSVRDVALQEHTVETLSTEYDVEAGYITHEISPQEHTVETLSTEYDVDAGHVEYHIAHEVAPQELAVEIFTMESDVDTGHIESYNADYVAPQGPEFEIFTMESDIDTGHIESYIAGDVAPQEPAVESFTMEPDVDTGHAESCGESGVAPQGPVTEPLTTESDADIEHIESYIEHDVAPQTRAVEPLTTASNMEAEHVESYIELDVSPQEPAAEPLTPEPDFDTRNVESYIEHDVAPQEPAVKPFTPEPDVDNGHIESYIERVVAPQENAVDPLIMDSDVDTRHVESYVAGDVAPLEPAVESLIMVSNVDTGHGDNLSRPLYPNNEPGRGVFLHGPASEDDFRQLITEISMQEDNENPEDIGSAKKRKRLASSDKENDVTPEKILKTNFWENFREQERRRPPSAMSFHISGKENEYAVMSNASSFSNKYHKNELIPVPPYAEPEKAFDIYKHNAANHKRVVCIGMKGAYYKGLLHVLKSVRGFLENIAVDSISGQVFICFVNPIDAQEFYNFFNAPKSGPIAVSRLNMVATWTKGAVHQMEDQIATLVVNGASRCLRIGRISIEKTSGEVGKDMELEPGKEHVINASMKLDRSRRRGNHRLELCAIVEFNSIEFANYVKDEIEARRVVGYTGCTVEFSDDPCWKDPTDGRILKMSDVRTWPIF